MRLHVAAVYRHGGGDPLARCQSRQDSSPMVTARPAIEAVVDRRRRAVFGRAVLPAAAALQNMDDTADDPTIIHPARTGLVLRKMGGNRRPGIITQPKNLAHSDLQGADNHLKSKNYE